MIWKQNLDVSSIQLWASPPFFVAKCFDHDSLARNIIFLYIFYQAQSDIRSSEYIFAWLSISNELPSCQNGPSTRQIIHLSLIYITTEENWDYSINKTQNNKQSKSSNCQEHQIQTDNRQHHLIILHSSKVLAVSYTHLTLPTICSV